MVRTNKEGLIFTEWLDIALHGSQCSSLYDFDVLSEEEQDSLLHAWEEGEDPHKLAQERRKS